MASQKSHIFRVTGLSREQPDENLKTALQEALNDNFIDDERSQMKTEITIVPSCYESDTQRVALVQFRGGVPQFLYELRLNPLGDWQVEMEEDDINIDCHFFGFTQLYAPDDNEPVAADIIAIAGLDGHAYGSWQGRGNLARMWLRDFLSKDLPQCRTMIYGYNSKLSSHGVDTILDYGRELMEEIKKIRNTKELQQRPLIFIAHSFGGIILAHCLVRAIQTMEEDHPAIKSLHRATYGMILFAIPHKGLVMDDIQQMLAGDRKHPREQLLRQISSNSDVLIHQLADFKNLIRDRKVISLYETKQTRQLVLDSESRQWKRTGDFMTTLDADSALLQLPDHIEEKVPLHFLIDAPSVVAARFTRTRLKPQPCSTVPFQKDSIFVGREAVISAVKERHGAIGQRHERVALVGLAGVGTVIQKNQIAIEYSYLVEASKTDTWVFWIHASNAARFEQGYQQIAAVAEIPRRDDLKMNNADDDGFFFSNNELNEQGPLASFLPQAAHGSILITSRNGRAARNLVGNERHVIAVQPMSEAESLALLRARIPAAHSGECGGDEKALVQVLEYIPLAITQAGSYIANRSSRVTVSRYLQLFRESESNQKHLLQHEDAKDLRRDPSIRYAVITTWQLSFEQIRHDRPAATELLAFMSMYDRQGILESLVRADCDDLQFEDALAPLISYSLVRFESKTASFDMHRLVQLSVRTWLEIHLELARWQEKSRAIVAKMFPDGQYESWTECQRLLPHAKEVMKSISSANKEDRLHVATISFNCGWYLLLQGAYEEAEVMYRRALEAQEKVLGREHPDTLTTVSRLGLVLSNQGKYGDAEAMHRRCVEGSEKVLGCEHPDTLINFGNLGNVLSSQGKFEAAKAMYRRALEAQSKMLGREHPHTLTSVSRLGLVLSNQGKYKEAEAMHRRALKAQEKVLGRGHPHTITSIGNLGTVLSSQGRYEAAKAMYRQALEAQNKVLGAEHPHTLISVNRLGLVLSYQGKYKEAEAMHRRALETREKVLGREHPDTLTSASNLGNMLSDQGKYQEAEAMYRRVLEAQNNVLGAEHPHKLTSVSRLGLVLSNQGKYEDAEALHRQALEAREKVLGREHPDTLTSVSNLGNVLSSQGKYEEAEAMQRRDLEGNEKVLGFEHPNTLISVNELGLVLFYQGKYEEAEAMHRRALKAQEKVLGRGHPHTITSIGNLGTVLSC
ncbi:hypothetical protein N7520_005495 [Penicillium odoratum]|uniref:uncharacterized protein n=1 Tax=Penicillium odoratum TaxID=1167516 RepID=UPI0025467579|nr:uncharacterized protein N7520_005495 [Penicillium odoratum]KAJ5765936.1 hypothetical protein N7520_005495 [Penicillium odoratum]